MWKISENSPVLSLTVTDNGKQRRAMRGQEEGAWRRAMLCLGYRCCKLQTASHRKGSPCRWECVDLQTWEASSYKWQWEGVSGGALAQAENVHSDSSIVSSVFCWEFGGTAPHLGNEQCILVEATGSCSDNQGSPESRMP